MHAGGAGLDDRNQRRRGDQQPEHPGAELSVGAHRTAAGRRRQRRAADGVAVERSAAPIRRVRLASDHRLRRFWADGFLLRIYARRRFASGWLPRLSRQTQSRYVSCSSPPDPIPDVMAQHDQGQTSSGLKPVPPLRLAGFEVPELWATGGRPSLSLTNSLRASMTSDLIAPDAAMLMSLLCLC